jgi:ferrochelatase
MNLGTPEATDYWSMRRYLKEFLSDRRSSRRPRLLWWPLLNGIILTTRPSRKGRDYDTIWNKDLNEGPLKTITRSQSDKMAAALKTVAGGKITVDWAMRYGAPPVAERLQRLLEAGCDRILLVPLYPQYSAATSATACDHAFRALMEMRWQPSVRVSPPYHDDPVYIDALVASMRRELEKLTFEPEVILVSFHGVPKSYLLKGDPYHCHCVKTWRLLRDAFGGPDGPVPHELPVPLRNGGMAPALHGQDRGGPGGGRRQAHGDHRPRLLGGLPGNPGGAQRREPRDLHASRRRAVRLSALPQRQPGRDARHSGGGRAGASGLDLKPTGLAAFPGRPLL